MSIMYMRLEGALQSYAENGCWENRGSAPVPTKSAVIGMLGAAFGYEYGSEKLEQLNNRLKMAVRVNHPFETFVDFQTIHAARVPDKPGMEPPFIHKIQNVTKADGKTTEFTDVKPGEKYDKWILSAPKLRDKTYLVNASFTVFLKGEDNLLKQICDALMDPAYCLYLGRSSCIPSRPILGCMTNYTTFEDAWRSCDLEKTDPRCIVEYDFDNNTGIGMEVLLRNDNIHANYQYTSRKVIRKEIDTDVFK